MRMLVLACFGVVLLNTHAMAQSVRPERQPAPALKLDFEPSSPIESRLRMPPEALMRRYREAAHPTPIFRELSPVERAKVAAILQQLPPYARKSIAEHVRSISFVEGIPANATTIKDPSSTVPVFDVVFRAGLLNETVSEFLTRKERSYYTEDTGDLTLSVEAGSLSAVLYVLLHECVHVLDITNRAGQEGPPHLILNQPTDELTKGVWINPNTLTALYQSPLLKVSLFGGGKLERLEVAEAKYRQLAKSPFVSLYGSSNWYDDIAELVTCYYLTQTLRQPYRIILRNGPDIVYSLEPMQSAAVRFRLPHIQVFFND